MTQQKMVTYNDNSATSKELSRELMNKNEKLHKYKCTTMSFVKEGEWYPLDRIKDSLWINIKDVTVLSISWKIRMHFTYTEMVEYKRNYAVFYLCVYIL